MRKGAGISALSRHTAASNSYSALSTALTAQNLTLLKSSLDGFRTALVAFAAKHRADIRKDPAFRHQFQKMCAAIGVDPLASAGAAAAGPGGGGGVGKGAWWTEALGLGEWQCELALQVVDVCVSTRERNGGIIEMGELIARVERMRRGTTAAQPPPPPPLASSSGTTTTKTTAAATITEDDVRRSLDMLSPLHAGYTLLDIGGVTFVRSVPRSLDTDQSLLLVLAYDTGGALTEGSVMDKAGWGAVRARTALDDCVMREGLGWVDDQGEERTVWVIAAVDFGDSQV